MLGSLDNGFRDGGHGGKVHVRDPHGDDVKAVLGQVRGKAGAETVNGDGVLAVAIHDGCKIVLHSSSFFLACSIPGAGLRAPYFYKQYTETSTDMQGYLSAHFAIEAV